MRILFQLFFLILVFCSTSRAEVGQAPDQRSKLASPWAEQGGRLRIYVSQFPKSFNYLIDNNVFSQKMFSLMFESLLGNNALTLQEEEGLAHKWEISADKLHYTFHLDPRALWSDGRAVTAQDVAYTFEALKNPQHLTGPWQAMLGRLTNCVVIDTHTVKISASEVHWKNLSAASSFPILPAHWWSEQEDFNKVSFEFPVVNGAYRLSEVKEPHYVRLQKRSDYWNKQAARNEGLLNFDEIEYRFYSTRDNAYEVFKDGGIDFFAVYTSSRWIKETDGERFDRYWIAKQSIHNANPIGFQGFAMNQRREPFSDKRVRKAISHLIDRQRMNNDLMYNQYRMTGSYFPDLWDNKHPNPRQPYPFDIAAARQLLNEAGWKINPSSGLLEKDGKALVLKFLTRNPSSNKFLLIFEEALKEVGITLKIDQKDWSAWTHDMDEYNFDITWSAWGAASMKDPEPMWHSKHRDLKGGINITGFSNAEVDSLCEEMRELFDVEKRHEIVRKIDAILFEECPYALLWHIDYTRLLYWNRFAMPEHVLGKYGNEFGSSLYWWADPTQEAELKAAQKEKYSLPAVPAQVYFEQSFSNSTLGETMETIPLQ